MRYLLSIAYCLASLKSCSQNDSRGMEKNINKDTDEVLAVIRNLADRMIARDSAAITKILHKDFTLTHITGYVQSKSEWLDEIAKERMKYYTVQEVTHSINVNGNTANVTVKNMVDARIWGSRNTWRLQQKMELGKRDGNWIILRSIASTF